MHELRLVGVHEDGRHVLLADPAGGQYRLPLDEALRAAALRDRPRLGQLQIEIEGGLRPAEVQALIRRGLSAEEVAGRAGWSVEKVHRYEGPVLAEREYIAGLARKVSVGAGRRPGATRGAGSGPAARPRRRAGPPLVGLRPGRGRAVDGDGHLPRRRARACGGVGVRPRRPRHQPPQRRGPLADPGRDRRADPRSPRRHGEQPAEHRLRRRGRGGRRCRRPAARPRTADRPHGRDARAQHPGAAPASWPVPHPRRGRPAPGRPPARRAGA